MMDTGVIYGLCWKSWVFYRRRRRQQELFRCCWILLRCLFEYCSSRRIFYWDLGRYRWWHRLESRCWSNVWLDWMIWDLRRCCCCCCLRQSRIVGLVGRVFLLRWVDARRPCHFCTRDCSTWTRLVDCPPFACRQTPRSRSWANVVHSVVSCLCLFSPQWPLKFKSFI